MKSFLSFFSEARSSNAAETAANMGLEGDGHGNWFKKGQLFAKTVKGRLEYVKKTLHYYILISITHKSI